MCFQRSPVGMRLLKIECVSGVVVIPIDQFISVVTHGSRATVSYMIDNEQMKTCEINTDKIDDILNRATALLF